ncbi:hypothetical protein [Streptomyces hilarionis]|uniref:hypothetical protein n=1 Tax=Streptomyces hilarionis TaxID=2839954 RepID=UPI00211A6BC0|nr:hypothetical protein [Streptomyces hilarionis]MCQ9131210.1 hypothetical protein [Streptomyces hilarionis]
MAHHFATEIPPHLSMWQRVREYAVPPSMIEEAAARRAVGDWAGACAAARVYVDLDLRAVRDRHGTDLTARLRQDLRRLAPDLLRWHMPRSAPDGRLRPGLTLTLARYRRPGGAPLHLVVRTPPARADGGQHMSLALWEGPGSGSPGRHPHPHPHPERRFRLDLHRHLWDADRVGELAWRCGVDGLRSRSAPDPGHPPDDPFPADATEGRVGLDSCWAVGRWAAEAELLLRAEGLPRGAFTVRLGSRSRTVLELVAPDDSHVPALRPLPEDALPPHEVAVLPVLPEAAARVLPDLELLRAGLVPAERLHPLLVDVLAPNGSASAGSSTRPPGDPHRVECRGEVHRIALRDGVLTAVDHDRDQLRREEMLVALGGPPLPCLRAIDAVHRAPEALPAVRERLGHGDVTGAFAVLEGLLGPGAILRDGPLRDELDSAMARRLEHGLFRSGLQSAHLAAGDAGSDGVPGARRARSDHRPRLERRTPPSVRHKLSSRSRPRIGLLP